MSRELPKVHLDFITPSPGLPLLRSMVNYASGFLGLDKKRLLKIIRSTESTSTSENILNYTLALLGIHRSLNDVNLLVKNIYGFGNKETAQHHFLESQKTARQLINYLVQNYGFDVDRFGLKDEVSIPDSSLERMFVYMNPNKNNIIKKGTAPRTRFEQLRELILCDLALRSDIRAKKEKPFSKISELQQSFNNELYEGQAGLGEQIVFNVSFNKENGVDKISRTHRKGTRKKVEEMRTIKIGNKNIHIKVDFDTKSGYKKIIKMMTDFYEKGILEIDPFGLDPDEEPMLQDRQRFSVVVYGNDDEISAVTKKINSFFENVREKQILKDHGQNPTLKKRYIAEYKGAPFEIVYYDEKGFINSQKHIGKIKQITVPVKIDDKEFKANFNVFDGSAHELYEIRRTLSIIFLMFPYEIYKLSNQSEEEYIKEIVEIVQAKTREVVHKLRNPNL